MKAAGRIALDLIIFSMIFMTTLTMARAEEAKKTKSKLTEDQEMQERIKRCMRINRNEKLCGSLPDILKNFEDIKRLPLKQ